MKTIQVRLPGGNSYPVRIGAPLSELGSFARRLGLGRKILVVSDRHVGRLYTPPITSGLRRAGFDWRVALIQPGESAKNLNTIRRLYTQCLRAGLDRRSAIIALGGGVVGDTAGFVAASFMRGVPLIQCPTTLLAMVDSSIGGKVGVDLPEGKNLVGAFWQPRLVWMDTSVLKTLPDREWRTGMAEVIKYGLIRDPGIISRLERTNLKELRRAPVLVQSLAARSVAIKARVVSADERETRGLREILNLGHTFGHAIETVTGYRKYTHGEAIAIGMCAAARLSARLGYFSAAGVPRVERIFQRWGLPVRARRTLSRVRIMKAISRDKKNVSGRFRFVLPTGWGEAKVVSLVSPKFLQSVLDETGL